MRATGSGAVSFSRLEEKLISTHDTCTISTAGADGWPHSVPVGYLYLRGRFYVPTEQGSVKMRNIERSPKVTIVIDDEGTGSGVMLKCSAEALAGTRAQKVKGWMRSITGWDIGGTETMILELVPLRKSAWGAALRTPRA